MESPLKKAPARDFSKPENQQAYVLESHNGIDLLHKEMDVNRAEQALLLQRIQMMKALVNDIPSSDSEYSMLLAQIQMDQVEFDEIKRRENAITEQLKKHSHPKYETEMKKFK